MSSITDPRVATRSRGDRRGLLAIEAGQVVCPRRGILDIEQCWTCREFGGQAGGDILVCHWSRRWSLTSRPATARVEAGR
jgi:hypothetical protein